MSLRSVAARLVHYGRRYINEVWFRNKTPATSRIAEVFYKEAARDSRLVKDVLSNADAVAAGKPSLSKGWLKWFVNTPAADIRRNAAKRLMYGGRQATPYLGFVGINLISGHGLITKQDEMESICEEIRVTLGAIYAENRNTGQTPSTLNDLKIGEVIAKGCNAVVHEAKLRSDVGEGVEETRPEALSHRFKDMNLAVKMMFNYHAESNASTILRAMRREIVPAQFVALNEHENAHPSKVLPSHPNIVTMHCAFADRVPSLPEGQILYPDALPRRIYEDGSGRNMTLFMVMKRYHMSLQQYLETHTPSPTTCLLLLSQLLEGIEFMVRQRVAHRDLKCDNILLDISEGLDSPLLVITDFGCCLADEKIGLSLPFTSEEVDRGGNCSLMAPEILTAVPGHFSVIDYSRSDLWAVGSLIYEIFGGANPFYRSRKSNVSIDSRIYTEDELPELPNAPRSISRLTRQILKRDPKQRPSPAVAANVCHLLLWGPPEILQAATRNVVKMEEVLKWLVMEAAILVSQGSAKLESSVFSLVRNTFLSRVHIREVEDALTYFSET